MEDINVYGREDEAETETNNVEAAPEQGTESGSEGNA